MVRAAGARLGPPPLGCRLDRRRLHAGRAPRAPSPGRLRLRRGDRVRPRRHRARVRRACSPSPWLRAARPGSRARRPRCSTRGGTVRRSRACGRAPTSRPPRARTSTGSPCGSTTSRDPAAGNALRRCDDEDVARVPCDRAAPRRRARREDRRRPHARDPAAAGPSPTSRDSSPNRDARRRRRGDVAPAR